MSRKTKGEKIETVRDNNNSKGSNIKGVIWHKELTLWHVISGYTVCVNVTRQRERRVLRYDYTG